MLVQLCECVVPAACCRLLPSRRHTDTFPHVMPVVSIVSYSHTPAHIPHTHTSAHINMHMPQCIALWHCLCQYCCYVALFRVCTADRNAKTKQQRKKSQRKRQHLLQTFRRMRLPVYVCGTLMGSTAARILMDTHAN